jgi:Mrp family chromosome partitioning ATPase
VRHWRLALGVLVAVLAVSSTVALLWPKKYRSEAVVYYREGLQWNTNEAMSPRRAGQRLREILLSRAKLSALVSELGLHPELVSAGRLSDAVEEVREKIVLRFDQGDVFSLSYTGGSPQEAKRVTARLTELLIEENARFRTQQAEVAKEFLDSEKKRKETELSEKQAELLRFLAKHPEFAQEQATLGPGVTLRRSRAAEPAPQDPRNSGALGALRREEQRLRRQLSSPGEIPSAPPDPALVAARNDAAAAAKAAHRDLALRRERFTDQHPDVRAAAVAAVSADAVLRRATEALATAQAPLSPAMLRERLAWVEQDIAAHLREHPRAKEPAQIESSDAARRIVAVETEWSRLNREVDEAKERLQHLDTQQFVASMTATMMTNGQAAQITVVDPAFEPAQPIGMRKKNMALLTVALSLALALGSALAAAVLDDVVTGSEDVERLALSRVLVEIVPSDPVSPARGGAPGTALAAAPPTAPGDGASNVLAELARRVEVERVPARAENGRVAMLQAPDGGVAAGYRVLRQRILECGDAHTILVTSPRRGDGKTVTAVNLALALAEPGRERVLLLEANFRTQGVARLLGFAPPACLAEQIDEHRAQPAVRWRVIETANPFLHVAAVSPDAPCRPIVDSQGLALCIAELREAGYDRVVVDSPPVLGNADVNVLEMSVEKILMVARSGSSRAVDLRKAAAQIGDRKLLGFVILPA